MKKIIGIGNQFRADDCIGLEAIAYMKKQLKDDTILINHSGEIASLVDEMKGADQLIIIDAVQIDAVQIDARPGEVKLINALEQSIPRSGSYTSGHGMGLAEALELAKILSSLPAKVHIIGIAGKNFQVGEPMSYALAPVLEKVKCYVYELLEST